MIPRIVTKSIGRKLTAAFGIMVVLTLLVGIVGVAGITRIDTSVREGLDTGFKINDLSMQAQAEVLQAAQLEKEYRLLFQQLGVEAARTQYANMVSSHLENARGLLETVTSLDPEQTGNGTAALEAIVVGINDFETRFQGTIALMETRGTLSEGWMLATLNDISNSLEVSIDETGDPVLVSLFGDVREPVAAYMINGDSQYLAMLEEATGQLKTAAGNSELESSDSLAIQNLADSYLYAFTSLVNVDTDIAVSVQAYTVVLQDLVNKITDYTTYKRAEVAEVQDDIFTTVERASTDIVIAIIIAFLISVTLRRTITRGITIPLRRIGETSERLSAGDFSQRIQVNTRDETRTVADTFNLMADNLQGMIEAERASKTYLENTVADHLDFVSLVAAGDLTNRLDLGEELPDDDLYQLGDNLNDMVESLTQMAQQVREASRSILSATSEIQSAATQQTAGATEQASIVTETVATVEEIRTTVLQTAERAQIVANMAQQTVDVSMAGESAVSDTIASIDLLRERVGSIAENILLLSERTQQIGEIIDVVNGIAEQSKLLALNASIEAARAGEEGKGFAVVAMEVRQLAEQSREATGRVGSILTEIQQATNNAVMVTEEGSKGAESSMELVDRAGGAIRELASSIAEAAQAATQIAASTHQQTNGMDQLSAAMHQIKQATSQTVAGMKQTELGVRDLLDMARQLDHAAERYQLQSQREDLPC